MTERRTAERYRLSLPLMIHVSEGGRARYITGELRDISTSGIYFRSPEALLPGATVTLTLSLPYEPAIGSPVLVHAQGTVIRTDDDRGEGVAARIRRYDFVEPQRFRPAAETGQDAAAQLDPQDTPAFSRR